MKNLFLSLLLFMLVSLTWGAGYFAFLKDSMEDKQALQEKIQEKRCILGEIQELSQGDYPQRYAQLLQPLRAELQVKIPASAEFPSLLRFLDQTALEAKVSLRHFGVGQEEPFGFWYQQPAFVTLAAGFPQLMNFLEKVAESNRLIEVEDVSYQNNQAELRINTYFGQLEQPHEVLPPRLYHCGKHVLSASFEKPLSVSRKYSLDLAPWGRDPFVNPQAKMGIEGIHLVGVVLLDVRLFALLEDRFGAGQTIQVGDTIVDDFVVRSITSDSVQLAKGSQIKKLTWSQE